MKTNLKFRKDIEALRGFAVISVLFYHFELVILKNTFTNGYIGVDLFFVISGYIITKIILENNKDPFSLSTFYSRRIKRIIPLMVFVIILTLIFIFFIFDYFILKKNINSAYSIIASASNVYFWLTSTVYGLAEKNSLVFLHFWSLSIEMQFYIFFPLLFFFFKKNLVAIRIVLIIFFLISYLVVIKIYRINDSFNFYSSVTRMFEFASGSLFFLFEDSVKKKITKKFFNNFYILGFFLIILFMTFNVREGPHPFYPVFILGIGLMLIFNDDRKFHFIKKYFSQIGKISYSLYLWHFPFLVIGANLFKDFNDLKKIIFIFLCFILSVFTYNFVEVKFRSKKTIYSVCLFLFLIIFLFAINFTVNKKKESFSKFNSDNLYLADKSGSLTRNKKTYSPRKNKNIFSNNDSINFSPQFNSNNQKTKILIAGDSHSKDLFNVFETNKLLFPDYEFARYGIGLKDFKNYRKKSFINSFNFQNADFIFFSARYQINDLINIDDLIKISKFHNKKLVFSLRRPEFKSNNHKNQSVLDLYYLDNKIIDKELFDKFMYKNLANQKEIKKINELIKNEIKEKITLFDIYNIICDDENKVCQSINNDGKKNFYDKSHFTLDGSQYFGEILHKKSIHKKIFKSD